MAESASEKEIRLRRFVKNRQGGEVKGRVGGEGRGIEEVPAVNYCYWRERKILGVEIRKMVECL